MPKGTEGRAGSLEEKRGHAKNVFMLNVIFNLIWLVQKDPYEQCYQALNLEMVGKNSCSSLYGMDC